MRRIPGPEEEPTALMGCLWWGRGGGCQGFALPLTGMVRAAGGTVSGEEEELALACRHSLVPYGPSLECLTCPFFRPGALAGPRGLGGRWTVTGCGTHLEASHTAGAYVVDNTCDVGLGRRCGRQDC